MEGSFSIKVWIRTLHSVLFIPVFQSLCFVATLYDILMPMFVQVKPVTLSEFQSKSQYDLLCKYTFNLRPNMCLFGGPSFSLSPNMSGVGGLIFNPSPNMCVVFSFVYFRVPIAVFCCDTF